MTAWIDDLFLYNDWANGKILKLGEGLPDEVLDAELPIGMGTLRKTLFHILTADRIWLERWQNLPWRPFPTDPEGMTMATIKEQLAEVAASRRQWINEQRGDEERADGLGDDAWDSMCEFQDSEKMPFKYSLADLRLHVVIHGIHHRAQTLAYLKSAGRTIAGGIDYLFYRAATAATPQSNAGRQMFVDWGLDFGTIAGADVQWDQRYLERMFQYHDWANDRVLGWAAELSDDQLRHDHNMGPDGTLLGVLQHLVDVESWWTNSCQGNASIFGTQSALQSVAEITERHRQLADQRNAVIARAEEDFGAQLMTINFGGPDLSFQTVEGLTQMVLHGAHHRAQLINLLRRNNAPIKNIDLLYALSDLSS